MEVDDDYSKVLTINTHKGLYKLNRFPFGLKVDPSFFRQVMDTMLRGFDFAIAYLDNILIKRENNNQYCDHIKKCSEGSIITVLSTVQKSVNFSYPKLNILDR